MKKILSVICAVVLCLAAFAACAKESKVQGEPVVSLVWDGKTTVVNTDQWNENSFQISTEDIGLGKGDGKIYDYVGVRLSTLMGIAGAEDCTKVSVKASDGLSAEIPVEDIKAYDIALVSSYSSGKSLGENVGGPLKLVFPVSEHPELKESYSVLSWQWYVIEVEFIR